MKPGYEKPPYQPKWILNLQVWLLRRHLLPRFNKQCMVITTTGRKSGRSHTVPIGYVHDGNAYLAINMGGHSAWYLNALANSCVTLEVDGKVFDAHAEQVPVNTPESLDRVLTVYRHERPGTFEDFLQISLDAPIDQLMDIGKYMTFIRFNPM